MWVYRASIVILFLHGSPILILICNYIQLWSLPYFAFAISTAAAAVAAISVCGSFSVYVNTFGNGRKRAVVSRDIYELELLRANQKADVDDDSMWPALPVALPNFGSDIVLRRRSVRTRAIRTSERFSWPRVPRIHRQLVYGFGSNLFSCFFWLELADAKILADDVCFY